MFGSLASVFIGVAGLAFLILYPPLGIFLIILGLLLYIADHNIRRREEDRRWREEMLKRK